MPISKSITSLSLILCALALVAQTTPPAATQAIQTVGTNPAAATSTHRPPRRMVNTTKTRIQNDATRLAALLADTQGTATLSPASWKAIANEANALANRLVATTAGNKSLRKTAVDARAHVREMHSAAMKGDAAGAKAHAGMALPFVYQLAG